MNDIKFNTSHEGMGRAHEKVVAVSKPLNIGEISTAEFARMSENAAGRVSREETQESKSLLEKLGLRKRSSNA